MLPSMGLFQYIVCPGIKERKGCTRLYCHFKHSSVVANSKSAWTSYIRRYQRLVITRLLPIHNLSGSDIATADEEILEKIVTAISDREKDDANGIANIDETLMMESALPSSEMLPTPTKMSCLGKDEGNRSNIGRVTENSIGNYKIIAAEVLSFVLLKCDDIPAAMNEIAQLVADLLGHSTDLNFDQIFGSDVLKKVELAKSCEEKQRKQLDVNSELRGRQAQVPDLISSYLAKFYEACKSSENHLRRSVADCNSFEDIRYKFAGWVVSAINLAYSECSSQEMTQPPLLLEKTDYTELNADKGESSDKYEKGAATSEQKVVDYNNTVRCRSDTSVKERCTSSDREVEKSSVTCGSKEKESSVEFNDDADHSTSKTMEIFTTEPVKWTNFDSITYDDNGTLPGESRSPKSLLHSSPGLCDFDDDYYDGYADLVEKACAENNSQEDGSSAYTGPPRLDDVVLRLRGYRGSQEDTLEAEINLLGYDVRRSSPLPTFWLPTALNITDRESPLCQDSNDTAKENKTCNMDIEKKNKTHEVDIEEENKIHTMDMEKKSKIHKTDTTKKEAHKMDIDKKETHKKAEKNSKVHEMEAHKMNSEKRKIHEIDIEEENKIHKKSKIHKMDVEKKSKIHKTDIKSKEAHKVMSKIHKTDIDKKKAHKRDKKNSKVHEVEAHKTDSEKKSKIHEIDIKEKNKIHEVDMAKKSKTHKTDHKMMNEIHKTDIDKKKAHKRDKKHRKINEIDIEKNRTCKTCVKEHTKVHKNVTMNAKHPEINNTKEHKKQKSVHKQCKMHVKTEQSTCISSPSSEASSRESSVCGSPTEIETPAPEMPQKPPVRILSARNVSMYQDREAYIREFCSERLKKMAANPSKTNATTSSTTFGSTAVATDSKPRKIKEEVSSSSDTIDLTSPPKAKMNVCSEPYPSKKITNSGRDGSCLSKKQDSSHDDNKHSSKVSLERTKVAGVSSTISDDRTLSSTTNKTANPCSLRSEDNNEVDTRKQKLARIAHVPKVQIEKTLKVFPITTNYSHNSSTLTSLSNRLSGKVVSCPLKIDKHEPSSNLEKCFRQSYVDIVYSLLLAKGLRDKDAAKKTLEIERAIYSKITKPTVRSKDKQDVYVRSGRMRLITLFHDEGTVVKGLLDNEEYPTYMYDQPVYNFFSRLVLSNEQLEQNGYPMMRYEWCQGDGDDDEFDIAYISKRAVYYTPLKKRRIDDKYICMRCKETFELDSQGFAIMKGTKCVFHKSKPSSYRTSAVMDGSKLYPCCGDIGADNGCKTNLYHVPDCSNDDELRNFKSTPPAPKTFSPEQAIFALDCEMVFTKVGIELARVTVVDMKCELRYDSYVKPKNEILDYNTEFSGITREIIQECVKTLEDVREELFTFIFDETLLIGHSLESDLKALKIVHRNVIDTSVLYPHSLAPQRKHALKDLASSELCLFIQQDEVVGHNSEEDAATAMKLVWKKAKGIAQEYKPRVIMSIRK